MSPAFTGDLGVHTGCAGANRPQPVEATMALDPYRHQPVYRNLARLALSGTGIPHAEVGIPHYQRPTQ